MPLDNEMRARKNITDNDDSLNNFIGIGDEEAQIFAFVTYSALCQVINIFGILTNSINIVCFVKEGFKDSVNVSLLGLSVSDLGSLVSMALTCIFVTCAASGSDFPFESYDIVYIVSGTPHFAFTRVSSCITAMITLERCLSIATPLKIKSIVTSKRTTLIISCIFIVFLGSATPIYVVNRLGITFSQLRNRSIFGIMYSENKAQVEKTSFLMNNFLIPFGAFIIIVICTTILSVQLKMKSEWRKTNVTGEQAERVSSRSQKVAKMVVLISSLYIVCFFPATVMMLAVIFEPALFINGKYVNLLLVISGIGYTLESINSSANIFIYHHMSSKYRDTFSKIFWPLNLQ